MAGALQERVHVLPCNLADCAAVDALVPQAEAAMGKLDILVANAGITRDNLMVQLSDEAWDEVIAVNLTATFRLTRAAIKGMMRRRAGRIDERSTKWTSPLTTTFQSWTASVARGAFGARRTSSAA